MVYGKFHRSFHFNYSSPLCVWCLENIIVVALLPHILLPPVPHYVCFFIFLFGQKAEEGKEKINGGERMRKKAKNISLPVASTVCTSTYALRRFGTVLDILLAFFVVFPPLHRSGLWRQRQHAFSHSIPFREPGLESRESNSLILRGITQGRSLTTKEAGLFPQGEFSYSSSSHSAYTLHPTLPYQPLLVLRASLCVARLLFLCTGGAHEIFVTCGLGHIYLSTNNG